jgi:hypothetical protein
MVRQPIRHSSSDGPGAAWVRAGEAFIVLVSPVFSRGDCPECGPSRAQPLAGELLTQPALVAGLDRFFVLRSTRI